MYWIGLTSTLNTLIQRLVFAGEHQSHIPSLAGVARVRIQLKFLQDAVTLTQREAGPMRRWPTIKPTLGQCIVLAEYI